jgi:four helix bundle protein
MSSVLTSTRFIAHDKALEAAGATIGLARRVPAPLKSIAHRMIRSASSVAANLAEGHGQSGRDRPHLWRIAYASAKEVDSHMRRVALAGAANRIRADDALELFDQVRAMTWRLLHPRC